MWLWFNFSDLVLAYLKDFRIHQSGKFLYFVVDHHDFDYCSNFFGKDHLAEPAETVENLHCFDFGYFFQSSSLLLKGAAPP